MKISHKAAIKGRENYYNGKIDIMNIPMIVPPATHFSYSYSRIYVIQSMDDVPSKCKVRLIIVIKYILYFVLFVCRSSISHLRGEKINAQGILLLVT